MSPGHALYPCKLQPGKYISKRTLHRPYGFRKFLRQVPYGFSTPYSTLFSPAKLAPVRQVSPDLRLQYRYALGDTHTNTMAWHIIIHSTAYSWGSETHR